MWKNNPTLTPLAPLARYEVVAHQPNTGTGFSGTLFKDQAGNYTLTGGAGSDTLRGGAGDDTLLIDAQDLQANINGGDGGDIAVYTGYQKDYELAANANGSLTVRDINLADGDDRSGNGVYAQHFVSTTGESANDIQWRQAA